MVHSLEAQVAALHSDVAAAQMRERDAKRALDDFVALNQTGSEQPKGQSGGNGKDPSSPYAVTVPTAAPSAGSALEAARLAAELKRRDDELADVRAQLKASNEKAAAAAPCCAVM